jgi:hypothetical protein
VAFTCKPNNYKQIPQPNQPNPEPNKLSLRRQGRTAFSRRICRHGRTILPSLPASKNPACSARVLHGIATVTIESSRCPAITAPAAASCGERMKIERRKSKQKTTKRKQEKRIRLRKE